MSILCTHRIVMDVQAVNNRLLPSYQRLLTSMSLMLNVLQLPLPHSRKSMAETVVDTAD